MAARILGFILVFSLFGEQTRASYWALGGQPAPRVAVLVFEPSWTARTFGWIHASTAWLQSFGTQPQGQRPSKNASNLGAPRSWQAFDPAAPQIFSGVNLANGNLFTQIPIVSWNNGVDFKLFHNSLGSANPVGLGAGWSHSYSSHIEVVGTRADLVSDDGARIEFTLRDGLAENLIYQLELRAEPARFVVTDRAQNQVIFDRTGKLQQLIDSSGNLTRIVRDTAGRVERVVDPVGRTLQFFYSLEGSLEKVQAPSLPYWNFVERIHEETPRVFELRNNNGRLAQIASPRRSNHDLEQPPLFQMQVSYDSLGRINSLSDYELHFWQIAYHAQTGEVSQITNPPSLDFVLGTRVATQRNYQLYSSGSGSLMNVTDEAGGISRYEFDGYGRLHRVTDPRSRIIARFIWNARNQVIASISPLGGQTQFEYDARGNLVSLSDERGQALKEYDALNRLVRSIDPLNQKTELFYEVPGQNPSLNPMHVKKLQGPGGALDSINFDWTAANTSSGRPTLSGLLRRMTDPNQIPQHFNYDEYGNLDASFFGQLHDPNRSGPGAYQPLQSAYRSSPTGEVHMTLNSCSSGVPVPRGGSPGEPPAVCDACVSNHDEMGNPTGSARDVVEVAPRGGGPRGTQPELFFYDGNNRLVEAFDTEEISFLDPDYLQIGSQYSFHYDELGRMIETSLTSRSLDGRESYRVPHYHRSCDYINHHEPLVIYPRYRVSYEYSLLYRKIRVRYERENEGAEGQPLVQRDPIIVDYSFDASGRLEAVRREGRITKFDYQDSTVEPAIVETRDDGSKSGIWMDRTGAVRKVSHTFPSGTVASQFEMERDAKGRIVSVQEEIFNPATSDGYQSDRVDFTYGDGKILPNQLDNSWGADPTNPQSLLGEKLYYRFLEDLGGAEAITGGDPNRLVRERRFNSNPAEQTNGVFFDKEYFYDRGGNRLAMRENDSSGRAIAVTRYNYFTNYVVGSVVLGGGLYGVVGAPVYFPEGPSPNVPDLSQRFTSYDGFGQNKLFSTQRFELEMIAGVETLTTTGEKYVYEENPLDPNPGNYLLNIFSSRNVFNSHDQAWEIPEQGFNNSVRFMEFDRGQLATVGNAQYFVDGRSIHSCERYSYDLLGRLSMSYHGTRAWHEDEHGQPIEYVQSDGALFYDYDGMGQNVVAMRRAPFVRGENGEPVYIGDRFVSTFTYGALGAIECVEESEDASLENNRRHFPLMDPFGGASGMLVENVNGTRQFTKQVFDAFGNRETARIESAREYAWRGLEGSETLSGNRQNAEDDIRLVLMQARHYEPKLGRFVHADSVPLSSLTTQGLNRYIYCNNDPVNYTDPEGLAAAHLAGFLAGYVAGSTFAALVLGTTLNMTAGQEVAVIAALVGALILEMLMGKVTPQTCTGAAHRITSPRVAANGLRFWGLKQTIEAGFLVGFIAAIFALTGVKLAKP